MTTGHLTTTEAAERLQTSARMIRYYVRTDRLIPAKRVGTAMLFDPDDVEKLAPTITRRNWKVGSCSSASALAVSPAVITGAHWALTIGAGTLALLGINYLQGEIRAWWHSRNEHPVPTPPQLTDAHVIAIESAELVMDPARGRVVRALGVEFWRSAYGQWVYEANGRTVAVPSGVVRALNRRVDAGWML